MFLCKVHYMRDRERGVVWEESIILVRPSIFRCIYNPAILRAYIASSPTTAISPQILRVALMRALHPKRAFQQTLQPPLRGRFIPPALPPSSLSLTRFRSRRQFASCFYPPPSPTRQVRRQHMQPPAAALIT